MPRHNSSCASLLMRRGKCLQLILVVLLCLAGGKWWLGPYLRWHHGGQDISESDGLQRTLQSQGTSLRLQVNSHAQHTQGPAVDDGPTPGKQGLVEFSVDGLYVPLRDALDLSFAPQPEEIRAEEDFTAPLSPTSEAGGSSTGVNGTAAVARGSATPLRRSLLSAPAARGEPLGRRGGELPGAAAVRRRPAPAEDALAGGGAEGEVQFIVLVTSTCCTHEAQARRRAARATWARYLLENHAGVDIKFVLAQPDGSDRHAAIAAAAELLAPEVAEFNDIVIVRGAEAYLNLPNKTLRLLRFMLSAAVRYTHVLKTDDDCYVRFHNLLESISKNPPLDVAEGDSAGSAGLTSAPPPPPPPEGVRRRADGIVRMTKVYTGCLENTHGFYPLRDHKSKWYTSTEEMPDDVVPWGKKYLAGWGYVLSRDVAAHVVRRTLRWERRPDEAPAWYPGLHWEDVLVGFVAGEVVEDIVDHKGYVPAWKSCVPETAVRHLDVDAPRVFQGLLEQERNGLWKRKVVQCSAGLFEPNNYWSWKHWRDGLPNVEAL